MLRSSDLWGSALTGPLYGGLSVALPPGFCPVFQVRNAA
jgi:hypothetical protein